MNAHAAILYEPGGELEVRAVTVAAPDHSEVVVKVVSSGICLSDLHGRAGIFGMPLPLILGHEGSGVVDVVGAGVTKVKPGDHVVMSVDHCGACSHCISGSPMYCEQFSERNLGDGVRPRGDTGYEAGGRAIHGRFCGQSSFTTHALVHERAVVKVARDIPLDLVGPFGCAVQTGAGGVANILGARVGEGIVIYGVGSVGLCSVMMASNLGYSPIVAVDLNAERLGLAQELGATAIVVPEIGRIEAQVSAASGAIPRNAVDTTGVPSLVAEAVAALPPRGEMVLLGVPAGNSEAPIDLTDVLFNGKTIHGSIQGDAVPDVFISRLMRLFADGYLPIDRFVTTFDFAEINDAIRQVERGDVVKAVVRMPV